MTTIGLDLSGPDIALCGVSEPILRQLREEWPAFVGAAPSVPFLEVTIRQTHRVAPAGNYDPKAMQVEQLAHGVRFSMPEGVGTLHAGGHAEIELVQSAGLRPYFTLMNLVRGCLAWRIRDRGGALIHAAGLVVDGRAFLLVGAEGAGKSTWARLGEAAGGAVISDDLVLIDGEGDGLHVVGGPFRSTHRVLYRPGRWPLAALLFPRHAESPRLTALPPLLARARIAANLPFLGAEAEGDARLSSSLDRLMQARGLQLDFGLDGGFLELLRALPA